MRGGFGVAHQWTKTLRVGLGLFAGTRIEDDPLVVPFISLEYRPTDRLTLAIRNGLNVQYEMEPNRTFFTCEAKYDSHRFRLDDTGPLPNGVIEYDRVPVSLGIRHVFSRNLAIASSLGLVVWHRFETADEDGDDREKTDADPTALLRLAVRFGL